MNPWQAVILSVVEGITEFLPISSTGHLILAGNLLSISQTEFVKSFEIIIQLGAIFAVFILYFKTLVLNFAVFKRVLTAFIPTGIIGYLLYKYIKYFLLGNTSVILYALLIGGIILILFEKAYEQSGGGLDKMEELSYDKALLIGIFQSFSLIPGVSRAAACIIGGLLVGFSRSKAVEFSFLLAIPTMFAAAFLDLAKSGVNFNAQDYTVLGIGFFGSFMVALLVVKLFISFIKKHTFMPFGIYRIIIAIVYWKLLFK